MSEHPATSAAAFEHRYQATNDPWNFATSHYEQTRYRTTLSGLRRAAYGRAFEPGCSVGELTAQLATRCAFVEACDFAPSAVARAHARCSGFDNVRITCADLRTAHVDGTFDLIVFSEIGYYFAVPELARIALELAAHLTPGGEFIAVHWTGSSADHVLGGDEVHETLRQALPLVWVEGATHTGFRLDSWSRR